MDIRQIATQWSDPAFHAEMADDEVRAYRSASAEEHMRALVEVCRLATGLMQAQPPDLLARTLAYQDPLGEREAALWLEWVGVSRRRGPS